MARSSLAPVAIAAVALCLGPVHSEELVQLDPFERATHGDPRCAEQSPPLMRAADARNEAHVRVERGLRCAMASTCEPGGAYKRDPDINAQVARAIAGERRFADTSIWVTTTRKWVTLQGCVRSAAQRRAVEQFAKRQPDVERVFDELKLSKGRR
jgi:hypothetical protein